MAMIDTADVVARGTGSLAKSKTAFSLQEPAQRSQGTGPNRSRRKSSPLPPPWRRRTRPPAPSPSRKPRWTIDTCNRVGTTYESLAKLAPVKGPEQFITAGNASQLSDGACACVLMEAAEAERLGLQPLGAFRGLAVAGC